MQVGKKRDFSHRFVRFFREEILDRIAHALGIIEQPKLVELAKDEFVRIGLIDPGRLVRDPALMSSLSRIHLPLQKQAGFVLKILNDRHHL